jgi:hypothetical protein
MSSEIIQSLAYDNYDEFQHVNFIFSQKFISLFWGLFNDETNLRVRILKFVLKLIWGSILLRLVFPMFVFIWFLILILFPIWMKMGAMDL